MKTFSEYIDEMKEKIPQEVGKTLPMAISKDTQKWMMNYPPSFMAQVINDAIKEINQGSVQRIEQIIYKRVK